MATKRTKPVARIAQEENEDRPLEVGPNAPPSRSHKAMYDEMAARENILLMQLQEAQLRADSYFNALRNAEASFGAVSRTATILALLLLVLLGISTYQLIN